jgi:putative phage-type endonuclease
MTLTTEQLRKIGGSDAAALVGVGHKRPIDIYSRVVEGKDAEVTPAMRRGIHMEPYARLIYQEETGAKLLGPTAFDFNGRPFLRANVDDIAEREGERRVVELKTSTWRLAHMWTEEEVPPQYLLQVQWYLRASGLERADLACLFGVDDFRIRTIDGDKELQEMLLDAACRFWVDHVEKKIPPPPDASDSYREFLSHRFPRHQKPLLDSNLEVDALVSKLKALEDRFEADSDAIEETRNQLKALIGDAEGVQGRWGKITWRNNKTSERVDWKAVAEAMGPPRELVQKFTEVKPGPRVFRCTWKD